jgi:uncharacterized protein
VIDGAGGNFCGVHRSIDEDYNSGTGEGCSLHFHPNRCPYYQWGRIKPLEEYALGSFRLSRRKFLTGSLLAGTAGAYGLADYTRHIEPQELSVEHVEIFLPRISPDLDGFKIALMSDFHYGAYIESLLKNAVVAANRAEVDVALLTGDFITFHHDHSGRGARDADACGRILSGLTARFGRFAVLGNHDYAPRPELVTESLEAQGIHVLRNTASAIHKNNSPLWLAGLEDALESDPDIRAALKGVPPTEPTIVLAHEPDYVDEILGYPIDLQLSGHSHGGQVRIPGIGAPVLPLMGEKYPMGFYRVGPLQLYTNRGLGMISPRIRFNCAPELTLLTLRCPRISASAMRSL